MNKFYVVTNRTKDPELETTNYICSYLKERGRQVEVLLTEKPEKCGAEDYAAERYDAADCDAGYNPLQIPEDTDCILVLGGDGTLLQTARDTVRLGIPLLGVNLGTLGFLAEVEKSGIPEALDQLMAGNYQVAERMLLDGMVIRDGKEIWKAHALNDVVVNRYGHLMVLTYEVSVNGQKLNRYQADGIILSTPTGSTGYNMSAGGPIVEPGARLMVMTPICPHTLNTRSIVLSATDTVEILINEGRSGQLQQAEINFDGGLTLQLVTGDRVVMQKSEQIIKLIHLSNVSFLEMLHKKMSEN